MDDRERVARIQELEGDMLASEGRRLMIEFKSVAQTYRLFLGNDRELHQYLARHSEVEAALRLWDLKNRAGFDAFLDEVGRLLHNYLAALGSLRDHSRRLWRTHLRDDAAYDEQVQAMFAGSGLCHFVQNLRNYTLHNQLPVAHGQLNVVPNKEFSSRVRLSRPDLLRWSGWPPLARDYLAGLPDDGIDLADLVAAYTDTVTSFNDWFGAAFAERNLDAFDRLRELETAYREALAGLDRSRAQPT